MIKSLPAWKNNLFILAFLFQSFATLARGTSAGIEAPAANSKEANVIGTKSDLSNEMDDAVRKLVDVALKQVGPALVRIHVVGVDYRGGREVKFESFGSGVIITREGHIVTNHHVAGRSKQLFCTLANREELEAKLVGTDPITDLSVIKLKAEDKTDFPVAGFGDSSTIRVGDHVLAMGSPLALSQSVTMGIVSNTEMILPRVFWPFKFMLEGEDVGSVVRWIGHDAPIYGGNSGGPLINLRGEIIGINEINLGLGGAIPSNLVKIISERIIKYGKVPRSWLGLEVQPLLKSAKLDTGILVSGTIQGSPAEKAGFRSGDILLELAGKPVSAKFAEELPLFNQFALALPAGKEIEAVILRDGKRKTLRLSPVERAEVRSKSEELSAWGMTARNLSLFTAKELKRKSQEGVLITSIRPGGPCAESKPNISEGDIIVSVGEMEVKNLANLFEFTERITKGQEEPVPVLVTFERKHERYITVVKVGVKKLEDPGREVRKAWLPVAIQVLTRDMAAALQIPNRTGVRITQVYPHGTAEKAGLKVGDLLVAVNGDKIPAAQPEDYEVLPTMIRQYRVGSTVELTVIREKQEIKVPVELTVSPRLPREMKKYLDDNFEFTARDVTFFDRVQEGWDENQAGTLVEDVTEGGWAALGQLAIGDLILNVNAQSVSDIGSLEKIMTKIAQEKQEAVVLQVRRGIHHFYIELKPSWIKPTKQASTGANPFYK